MVLAKKTFCLLLFLSLSSNLIFAQSEPRGLVVYYSRTGTTKKVAEELAGKFGADIERLIDKRKRTGPVGYMRASKDAVAKNLTDLEPIEKNPHDYDIIIIGTPSWYGNMTPAVRTFLDQNGLEKKTIAVFGTTNLTGIENACKQVAETVAGKDFEQVPVLPLRKRDLKREVLSEKIDEFYNAAIDKYRAKK